MSLLASRLATIIFLISCLFMYILILLTTTPEQNNLHTSKLIQLPGISLSTSYLGDRILEYSDESNSVYLGMQKDNYARFVYAK